MIDDSSRVLADELVAAFGPFVRERTGHYEVDVSLAIETGEAWLRSELDAELSVAYQHQRRGPLEIFQAAMAFPTEALGLAGIRVVNRDPMAVQALPGDRFDLAPASSRDISEAVWSAHLAWGVMKAATLRGLADPERS